ncbi:RNA-guided endonuclease InsQ/TnpB family protein [Micromonospora inyonensis]|uniref:Putative transposase n=1 Tax=Micromonospora inyonensis TaxID=47866 RepID=A0A1C6S696_9ACTN|nr:RNA-guided endonuclease TnpB family protein [Micromonospora inyonensis]SCL24994.1 putative transposase [Micromonospora inyonensis]
MSSRVVKRAYRFRFYPTDQQRELLNRTFGCVRYVYNRALAERSRAWTQEQRRVTFAETCRMLTAWKNEPDTAWLYEVSNVALQQSLQHLQQAYVNFWAKRATYPTFKSKRTSKASATFTTSGFSFRDGQITLAKTDVPLDIVWSRPLPEGAQPSTVTVSRDAANRWHISILVEETIVVLPPATRAVGIDAGITSLVTLSTGEKVTNPRHEQRDRERLAVAQRRLARTAKGSHNRAKARLKVARVHARIADRRRDHLHKLSTRIIRENQTVVIEDLSVRNMVRNHSLARAISDAAWSQLRRQLEYKADWYGRTVIAIDRFYPSSKTCSACGVVVEKLPLSVRGWVCRCGATHDRDVNAAKAILAAGLAVSACGDGVRPSRV